MPAKVHQKYEMYLFDNKDPSLVFCATPEWLAKGRYKPRPTAKVLVTHLEDLPPCLHTDVAHDPATLQDFACTSCGAAMEPTGFKLKEKSL